MKNSCVNWEYLGLRLWKTDWPYCVKFQNEVWGVVSLLFYLKVNKKLAGREPHMAPSSLWSSEFKLNSSLNSFKFYLSAFLKFVVELTLSHPLWNLLAVLDVRRLLFRWWFLCLWKTEKVQRSWSWGTPTCLAHSIGMFQVDKNHTFFLISTQKHIYSCISHSIKENGMGFLIVQGV